MIRDITIGQYIYGNSIVHRLDARIKVIMLIVFISNILFIDSYKEFVITTLFVMSIILTTKIPLKYMVKGIKPILPIIVVSIFINVLTIKGTVLFEFYIISISVEGLELAFKIALRFVLLFVSSSLITFTTTPISLTYAIEKLLKPLKILKIPVEEIALSMTIAIRFIPVLLEETDKIIKAQTSRGAEIYEGNLIKRLKNLTPILVPIFINTFRRADDLASAMEVRGYNISTKRTRYIKTSIGKFEAFSVIIFLIYLGMTK